MNYSMCISSWTELKNEAQAIRYEVFVIEQQVPVELEMDDLDEVSEHAVLSLDGQAIATGRLLPNAHIGRMAVLASHRGQGAGGLVLAALLEQAKQREVTTVFLSAQQHAIPFYERYGFVAYGEAYLDADMAHTMMRCDL